MSARPPRANLASRAAESMRGLILLSLLVPAACHRSAADNQASRLENAASQSDPAAAQVLDNAAGAMRDSDAANAQSQAQDALQAAGNAQVEAPRPNVHASPHQAGDPVPPPKSE